MTLWTKETMEAFKKMRNEDLLKNLKAQFVENERLKKQLAEAKSEIKKWEDIGAKLGIQYINAEAKLAEAKTRLSQANHLIKNYNEVCEGYANGASKAEAKLAKETQRFEHCHKAHQNATLKLAKWEKVWKRISRSRDYVLTVGRTKYIDGWLDCFNNGFEAELKKEELI